MQNKDLFTKIEIEPGGFATGYVRGCNDTLKCLHQRISEYRHARKAGAPADLPLIPPSFIIVIRRAGTAVLLPAIALYLSGCTGPRPQRGGRALTTPNSPGISQTLVQSDNPSQPSRQDQDTVRTRTYILPPGSKIEQIRPEMAPSGQIWTNVQSTVLSAPVPVTEREESHAKTELGAAQKDTARELTAKLSSLKSIVWVGLALFIFGIASFTWPPLRAIIGSLTTSAAITLGGLALIVLPTLIVGNELLILGGVTVAVGGWFLAHRHGHLKGQLTAAATTLPKPKPLSMTTGS